LYTNLIQVVSILGKVSVENADRKSRKCQILDINEFPFMKTITVYDFFNAIIAY
jgi:hypothetical protein